MSYATIAAAIGRPVLVGAVLQDPLHNAGQLWLPARGPVATYVKRQLVPFAEYIPFRGLLSAFTSLVTLQPNDFTAGHRAVVFRAGKIRLGDVICYQAGFDSLASSEVTAGASLLAVQSNDATFEADGRAGESAQQLAMARIRAIESDRSVVHVATTGISAIIAKDGSVLVHSGTWQRAGAGGAVWCALADPPGSIRPGLQTAPARQARAASPGSAAPGPMPGSPKVFKCKLDRDPDRRRGVACIRCCSGLFCWSRSWAGWWRCSRRAACR